MSEKARNAFLSLSLLVAIFLWGGSNAGTKYIVKFWPPLWTGGSRFLCAGLLLLAILGRGSSQTPKVLSSELKRDLWWRGGLILAVYIVCFNWALRYTAASHVALYLGASPVWALLWEARPELSWKTVQRFGAAALALAGVFVLFWPAFKVASASWLGETLGLTASLLWTYYGRQCRSFAQALSGAEITAHTMWRAGALLAPLGLVEIAYGRLAWRIDVLWVQAYCITIGGVVTFAIWNNALRYWPTSKVLLFNNLIPLSTMSWARVCLGEPVTSTFWFAMVLIFAGVALGQSTLTSENGP